MSFTQETTAAGHPTNTVSSTGRPGGCVGVSPRGIAFRASTGGKWISYGLGQTGTLGIVDLKNHGSYNPD